MGIKLEGTIALTRYGGVGRGAKVRSIRHAESRVEKGQGQTEHQGEEGRERKQCWKRNQRLSWELMWTGVP